MGFSQSDHSDVVVSPYVGRFAPSPTGYLHMGSLLAATASYLEARAHSGRWLLRIEDVDRGRVEVGAADSIVNTLLRFGFEWDGPVLYQSSQYEMYSAALSDLIGGGHVYPCFCSRRKIALHARLGVDGVVYPGTCRLDVTKKRGAHSWRMRTENRNYLFLDEIQGWQIQNLARDVGDFVLRRADGCWAYQLAVVVDDAASGVTHVVRGADLLDSSPRQIALQQGLNLPSVKYAHIPVLADLIGEKLSKQNKAPSLQVEKEVLQLWQCLDFLGQQPPVELQSADLKNLWLWAFSAWDLAKIPKKRSVSVTLEQKNEYKILF
ncbi:tRNA glutamyl-Q(34) synthetase GluQRS [Deefgea sp. CFH1-16]|uniref:tRNA glutamyl-Q(34) synthetase GluQRS n=1 Tax=Deefgea sp. CFH1-16 TaxID=2675457 RepID=UPI0015F4775B|nr:tRNA glutamyl-Q(34) synthetase GluQRS [Deefgea sp. CFH1-16]MBM5573091.1 tRNA glutamyl-Q(34) synthetase GluQRS [Deefgea sp. CFH1-16]